MILSSKTNVTNKWHEVKLETDPLNESLHVMEGSVMDTSPSPRKPKVHFAILKSKCVEGSEFHRPAISPGALPITDLCSSTLGEINKTDIHVRNDCIQVGYILREEETTKTRYALRLIRSLQQEIRLHSLQETLVGSPSPRPSPIQDSDELSHRDRLYLAALIACSVPQLHGSWLKKRWGTQDILFASHPEHGYVIFERPYLLWKVREDCNVAYLSERTESGRNRPQSDILFPLALALIELSLGRTISTISRPGDRDDLETAARVLQNVYCESGSNYGDVVKECLYWSRNKGEDFEYPGFDEWVFDAVVFPLLKDFDYFGGVSSRT